MPRSKDDLPRPSRFDDPDHQAKIEYLLNWLRDGRELKRLQNLVIEAKARPKKRRSRRYAVRNPDGSVYRNARNVSSSALDRRNQSRKIGQ